MRKCCQRNCKCAVTAGACGLPCTIATVPQQSVAMAGSSAVTVSGAAKGRFTLGLSRLMELGLIEEGEVLFYKVRIRGSRIPSPHMHLSLPPSCQDVTCSQHSAPELAGVRRKARYAPSAPPAQPASGRPVMTNRSACPPLRPCRAARCGGPPPTYGRPRARRCWT